MPVVLVEEAGAALGGRHAGLYHYALRFEERRELARAVRRLASTHTRIEGASDHGVSESIYLRNPDDNGIELYADRPRERVPPPRRAGPGRAGDRVEIFTVALDLPDLMRGVDGEALRAHAGAGLVVGHVHLRVGDLDPGLAFYRDLLGFEDRLMRFIEAPCVVFGRYEGEHRAPSSRGSRSRPPTRSPAGVFGSARGTVRPAAATCRARNRH